MQVLRMLDDLVGWLEDGLLAFGTAVLAVLLFANVLLRYVFKSPFAWMEEGVVAVFVWLVFIGVSAAFRSHQHLRIDVLVRFLPRAASLVVGAIAVTITFVILGFLVKLGYDYANFVSRNRTPVLGISAAWVYVGLPLGMALSLVHLVRQVIDEGPADVLKSVIETGEVSSQAETRRS
ncbi:MAG TPA: TRAP transporter small permease [Saliniramus sp.]|nr:TRAP transporter small permease [Saliniramus sp.]